MKQSGTARRIVKEPDMTFFIWIPVYYSKDTHRYHRVLPNFLMPFKHYITNVIRAAFNDDPDLDLYDLPSDSSRIRWNHWIRFLDPASLLVSYINNYPKSYKYPFLWPLKSRRL